LANQGTEVVTIANQQNTGVQLLKAVKLLSFASHPRHLMESCCSAVFFVESRCWSMALIHTRSVIYS